MRLGSATKQLSGFTCDDLSQIDELNGCQSLVQVCAVLTLIRGEE